jgi:hypothetical protein
MFDATMRQAIEGACTLAQFDDLSRKIWQAHAAEALTEDAAQGLAELLHARRTALREVVVSVGIPLGRVTLFPPRRLQRAPERSEAIARRRRLACSGPLPPALASRYTEGQRAVLLIVGDQFVRNGACSLCIDAIAARAGVCRRLAQGAIRLAEGDGLLTIQERRHQGRKSDSNVIRIINREWTAWLKRGQQARKLDEARARIAGSSIGCKPLHPTDKGDQQRAAVNTATFKEICRGAEVDLGRSDPVRIRAGGRMGGAMR